MSDDLRKLKVDDKWSILYDAGQNDRPLDWYRYDVLHTPFSNFNADVAMFYAFQEASNRIEELEAKLSKSEALLAKAMEVICYHADRNGTATDVFRDPTTAELKGETDE